MQSVSSFFSKNKKWLFWGVAALVVLLIVLLILLLTLGKKDPSLAALQSCLKDLSVSKDMTSLVIQALKTLGRTNVTPEIIQTLSEKLSEAEKQACLKEAAESTDWVYDTIRKMCGGDTQ